MAVLALILSAAVLAGGCLFVQMRGLPGGVAPLAVLSCVTLLLYGGGMLGILPVVSAVLYAVGLGLGAVALWQAYQKTQLRQLFSPAGAVFWCGAFVLLAVFALKQPYLTIFDEYSFWGTATRLTCLNDRLYTECDIGTPWQITQTPAVPLVGYFVQMVGDYADWKLIWAVDLLILAVVAAVVECASVGGWRLQLPAALVGLLTPFALVLYSHTSVLTVPYLEAMGDTVVGMLFGGAVAFWWCVRSRSPRLWWLMLPVACLVGNIKDNTFVLGLAAAGIAAADLVLFGLHDRAGRLSARRLAVRCGGALALLAAPAAQYLVWSRYIAALVAQNAQSGGMGVTSQPLSAVLVQGIRLFLGLPVTEYFEQRRETAFAYVDSLAELFVHKKVSLLGSGAVIVLLIALLFAGAVLLAPTLRHKLRAVLTAVCSAACFGGYWLMLLLSYAFILKDSSPSNPVSYNRYFQSYYIGWFLLALAVFVWCAAAARRPGQRWTVRACALALTAVFCVSCFQNLEPQFTVFGAVDSAYTERRQNALTAEWAVSQIPEGETVYLIRQDDDGFYWFEYSCRLLPRILVYGDGGGTYGLPEYAAKGATLLYSAPQLHDAVRQSGAAWLLVARSDGVFADSYAPLFSDELEAARTAPALYRVTESGFALAAAMGEGSL